MLQLITKNAPTLFQADQADDIIKDTDFRLLAFFWDGAKFGLFRQGLKNASREWNPAVDLILWYTHTCTRAHTRARTHTHTLACRACTHTCVSTPVRAHARTRAHLCTHSGAFRANLLEGRSTCSRSWSTDSSILLMVFCGS